METTFITINAVGRARRVTENGREYLVVPMTSIVEGVLPGSKGRLFYPADEIVKNVSQWDGTDIVVYHPTDKTTGRPIAVSDPAMTDYIRREYGTGFLRNSRVKRTGGPVRLQHDGWFDIELLKAQDAKLTANGKPAILPRLLNHQPVELSTGLFTDNIPVSNVSYHNGVSYDAVARNYRRDHLATLPDQKGACSLRDGCGVLVDNANAGGYGPGKNPNSHTPRKLGSRIRVTEARTLGGRSHDVVVTKHVKKDLYEGQILSGPHAGHTVKGRFKRDLPTTNTEEVEATYNRDWPKSKRDKLDHKDFAGPDKSFPIQTQADVDAAVHLIGKAADPEAVKARIRAIAKRKGLTVPAAWTNNCGCGGSCSICKGADVPTDNAAGGYGPGKNPNSHRHGLIAKANKATAKADQTNDPHDHRRAADAHDAVRSEHLMTTEHGPSDQKLSLFHLKMRDFHNAKYLGKKASRPTMNSVELTPTQNSDMADAASTKANNASEKAGKMSGQDVAQAHQDACDAHMDAADKQRKAADAHSADGNTDKARGHKQKAANHLQQAAEHQGRAAYTTNADPATQEPTVNKTTLITWLTTNCKHFAGKEKMLESLDEATLGGMKTDAEALVTANAKLVTNCEGPKSLTEMLSKATPQEQATWNTAVKIENRERTRLVGVLTANMANAAKKAAATKRFEAMETEALSDLVEAMPPVTNKDDPRIPFNTPAPIYGGSVFPAAPPAPVNNGYDGTKAPLTPSTDVGTDTDNPVLNYKKKHGVSAA